MIRRFVARAFASSFIRHATMLASGTVAANLITLVSLPLFSRLFSAEAFGLQALLIMGTMVLAGIGTGYYDWAIPTPKTKKQAKELATLALVLSIALSLAVTLVLVIFGQHLLDALAIGSLKAWAYALPPLGLALAAYNIGNYWLLRSGKMANLTQIRFVLPVTNAIVSFILGRMGYDTGLVTGFILGVMLSGAWSLWLAKRSGLTFDFTHPRTHYVALASKFREFPFYGSLPSTAMLIAGQIPLLVITRAYTLGEAGHYAIVRALLYSGTLMIATACAQVTLKHIAEAKNAGDAVWPHFIRMVGILAGVGLVIGAVLYLASPIFFRVYLGDAWANSADIAQLMAFAVPLWLVGISLASAPVALKRLRGIATWQICYGLAACYLFTLHDLPFITLVTRVITFDIIAYALYITVSVTTMYRHGR